MRRRACHVVSTCLILTAWLSVTDCAAQTSGGTLWDFLGIPTNAAAQASSNPAIAAAAAAKAAKHEICKKKKAIQYLAGMGCSKEHPEVAAALLAAMGDPDEPVRYEAVKAVMQTAEACQSNEQKRESRKALSLGDRCHGCKKKVEKAICDCIDRLCGKAPPKEHKHKLKTLLGGDDCPQEPENCGKGQGSCCTPEIREKLQQLAYGRDDQGCFLERSSRVRELAAAALQGCSACGGCECGDARGRGTLREMPPEESREMGADGRDPLLDGDCVTESRVVPLPPVMEPTLVEPLPPVMEPTLAEPLPPVAQPLPPAPLPPPPATEPPAAPRVPAAEPIPPPSASLEAAATRLAMAPAARPPLPAAALPTRPAPRPAPRRQSEIWNPMSPAETLAQAAPPSTLPGTIPVADLDDIREKIGTTQVGALIARLPGPVPAVQPSGGAVAKPGPPRSAVSRTVPRPTATPRLLRAAVITLTIVAAMVAIAGLSDGVSQRRRNRHE